MIYNQKRGVYGAEAIDLTVGDNFYIILQDYVLCLDPDFFL